MTMHAADATPVDISAAFAAVDDFAPGTVSWMRALLAWWEHRVPDASPASAFRQVLHDLGVPAHELHLQGPEGTSLTVVCANLGEASETTQGWAVIDPVALRVFTSPAGQMAHPEDLRQHPDWVAAERGGRKHAAQPGTEDWTFWASGPRALNFLIGDVCNMHCTMCWQDLRRAQQPQRDWYPEMTASLLRLALEQHLEDIDSVELVSFGEPMLNPHFDDIVRAIIELGDRRGRPFELNFITNGSLLHLRRHMDVIRQPGRLTVSLDGAEKELYESIREGASWEDVTRNLRAAAQHPDRHPDRRVGINMTVFAPNVEGVFAMGAFAAGLGLDYLCILHGAALDWTRAKGLEIDPEDPRLREQLDRIRSTFPTLQLHDYTRARNLPVLPAQALPGRGFCPLPWRQLDVGPDGRAHPCCRSYAIDLGTSMEAWTGEPLRELRRQILAGQVDPERFGTCAACPNLGLDDPALIQVQRRRRIRVRGQRVVVYGAGAGGREAIARLDAAGASVVGVCDTDVLRHGESIGVHCVGPFTAFVRQAFDLVVVASRPGYREIAANLEAAGLQPQSEFVGLDGF